MRTPIRLKLAAVTAIVMLLAGGVSGALAAAPPVKLILSSHFGREVNLTETGKGPALEDVCTVESKQVCQPAKQGSIPGGFVFPPSVAGAANGNVYVVDTGNGRVQELTSTGVFVLMFGKEVNKKGGDLCTAGEESECKAGVQGAAAGQFGRALSVAVNPVSGNVYVAEGVGGSFGQRVQEFTAGGVFVLEIGKEVNEKTKGNLCTEKEVEEKLGVKCTAPAQSVPGSSEHGAFNFYESVGNLLAVGGEGDVLYVGDENRVQEFDAKTGAWKGEISLEPAGGSVRALALDQATSDLYLTYGSTETTSTVVHELNSKGEKVRDLEVNPREKGETIEAILGLALDSKGHLAVAAREGSGPSAKRFGALYDASSGHQISELPIPAQNVQALGFNGQDELFVDDATDAEVLAYRPVFVAELLTGASACVPAAEVETSVRLDCTLKGEVNPEGVSETEVFVEWGRTRAFGETTPKQKVPTGEAPVKISTPLEGVRPNETFFYRLVGEDQNVKSPERLTSETASFTTSIVPAKILGVPGVSFVTSSSAVMSSDLNPENANTEYFFEYGTGEALEACPGVKKASCPGVAGTAAAQSAVYGRISTTIEASGLQAATTYRYRLAANNEGGESKGESSQEGTFTTAPAPAPQATTGVPSAIGQTSATVSGTVNPDGLPATYAFELGVYQGAATQYGVVFSGPAGASSIAVEEALALTGLQPGTTYAYRIVVNSGYGSATGEPVTFTTAGLPAVLLTPTPLAMLATPPVAFPAEPKPGKPAACKRGYKRDKHNKCVKPKKKAKTNQRKPHKGKK